VNNHSEIAIVNACWERTGTNFMLQPEFYKCLGYGNHYNSRRFSKVRQAPRAMGVVMMVSGVGTVVAGPWG